MKFYKDSRSACMACPIGDRLTKLKYISEYGKCPFNKGGACEWEDVCKSSEIVERTNHFADNVLEKDKIIADQKKVIDRFSEIIEYQKKFGDILIVEDGSVDVDKLKENGINVLVYRQGSCPPTFIKK